MLNNTEPGLRNQTGYANLNIHIKQEMGKKSHMKDRTTDARASQQGWQQNLGNKFTCQSCF